MKKIFVALVLSLIVVSCGNKNENGKEKKSKSVLW